MSWIQRALRAMTHFNIGATLALLAWWLTRTGWLP
jgi:hypothetical protein